jgi:hypothetical protein
MKNVHTAATEVEAVMLQGLLEAAGIPVALISRRIPFYPAEEPMAGWADLLVPDDHAVEARDLVAGYLSSLKEESPL